jgi:hypothetical protein
MHCLIKHEYPVLAILCQPRVDCWLCVKFEDNRAKLGNPKTFGESEELVGQPLTPTPHQDAARQDTPLLPLQEGRYSVHIPNYHGAVGEKCDATLLCSIKWFIFQHTP